MLPLITDPATLYRRAVSLLDLAQQKHTGDLSGAESLVEQSNARFTLLQKKYATVLAELELSPQKDQQLILIG